MSEKNCFRFNIMEDARTIDLWTFHGGCPVVEGEKWSWWNSIFLSLL
jgi:hypothetical protein